MAKGYDFLFKIFLLGDSNVGKKAILHGFSENHFHSDIYERIGIDFEILTVEIDGKKIKLQIWDTAGQERYRTIPSAFYRGAMGIMLVYDVTCQKSFDSICDRIRNIEENAVPDIEMMLLGNMGNSGESRVVSKERGQELADEHGIKFMEINGNSGLYIEKDDHSEQIARDIVLQQNWSSHDKKTCY